MQNLRSFLLFAAVALPIGFGAALLMPYLPPISLSALTLVSLPILLWGVIAVHEAGHLVGARAAGFRALLFACGPLIAVREGEQVRLEVNRALGLWAGFVAAAPVGTDRLRRRMTVFVAAGPAASLLAGSLALVAERALRESFPREASLLAVAGLLSLVAAILSLWPGTVGGFATDGAHLLRLHNEASDAEREVAGLSLIGLSCGGMRPREWDPELVRRAVGEPDGSLAEMSGRFFSYLHLHAVGRLDEARAELDLLLARLERFPPGVRPGILMEAAFHAAWYDRDAMRARLLLAGAEGALVEPRYQRPLVEAAIALAAGDPERARAHLERARERLEPAVDRGHALDAAERIEVLERACVPVGAG